MLSEKLPISILKVFPHYPEEYTYLQRLISRMGPEAPYSSERSFYVEVDKEIRGHHIVSLGIRVIDPYRILTYLDM